MAEFAEVNALRLDLRQFRPRLPWWGGDLQTLRNYIMPPGNGLAARVAGERLDLPMTDGSGDRLIAALSRSPGGDARPLIVLVHGLTGCADSVYMMRSAAHWLAVGHNVVRLNLRGAGASRALCRNYYHAGRSQDLRDVIGALDKRLAAPGVFLIGYSLGGNTAIKLLAESGPADLPGLIGAAVISAPLDLAATAHNLLRPRNRLYHRYLLTRLKAEALAPPAASDAAERRAVERAPSIIAFDDCFTAPRNGFADAQDYYAQNASARFLTAVARPLLVVHAFNDPWIPAAIYRARNWAANNYILPMLSAGGGHVGFHGQGDRTAWHDRCATAFVTALAGQSDATPMSRPRTGGQAARPTLDASATSFSRPLRTS